MMENYATNSLPIACYLRCLKEITFVGVDKSNPQRIYFLFKPLSKTQKAVDDYFAHKAMVNPREFFDFYVAFKDLIFEIRQNMPSLPSRHQVANDQPPENT